MRQVKIIAALLHLMFSHLCISTRSSHLLSEVEQVCDRVAIIHRGELIRKGKVKDLLVGEHHWLRLQVTPAKKALSVLAETWSVRKDSTKEGWVKV